MRKNDDIIEKVDPCLYGWISNYLPNFTPLELSKITMLEEKKYHNINIDQIAPTWCEFEVGNWSMLGKMDNLKVLEFPEGLTISDFNFLYSLKHLKKLDLHRTNFSDCKILQSVSDLKYAYLPNKSQLNNLSYLENCPFHIRFFENDNRVKSFSFKSKYNGIYAQVIYLYPKEKTIISPKWYRYDVYGRFQGAFFYGSDINPQIKNVIVRLISENMVDTLYISPFSTDLFDPKTIRPLEHDFSSINYPFGCSATIFNTDCSILLYHPIREQDRVANWNDSIEKDRSRVFLKFSDAAQFIDSFIQSGNQTAISTNRIASNQKYKIDPNLLQWISCALGRIPNTLSDLDEIVELLPNTYIEYTYPHVPDWCQCVPNDWSVLGRMKNLKILYFPSISLNNYNFLLRCKGLKELHLQNTNFCDSGVLSNLENLEILETPAAEFSDFEFLKKCKKLRILDISKTNFKDCELLEGLPFLELVKLPVLKNLIHQEALNNISATVKIDEPIVKKQIPKGELPYFSKEVLQYGKNGLYAQAISINGQMMNSITKQTMNTLLKALKDETIKTITVSPDDTFETIILEIAIKKGWYAVTLHDFENDLTFQLSSSENSEEVAPVRVEGQSPIPKSLATNNFSLISKCLSHYIKTGKLLSSIKWLQYDDNL